MRHLGDFDASATVRFLWGTNDANGASITRSTDGEVRVYKDGGVSQSTTGVSGIEDFDGLTGVHLCAIDLTADAVFYAEGSEFDVVLQGAVIDTRTVNAVLAHFSIKRPLAAAVITSAAIANFAISSNKIADDAITADKMAASAVSEIQSGLATAAGVSAVETDTQDIQSRLPAALVGGRIDASVGAMAANVLTAAALAADAGTEIAAAVWATILENSKTAAQFMRGMWSLLRGKSSGFAAGASTPAFRDDADSKNRFTATVDANGNRTAVTVADLD